MKQVAIISIIFLSAVACRRAQQTETKGTQNFSALLGQYYEDRLKLYPLEATAAGDDRYNDLLPNNGSARFLKDEHDFYQKYLDQLNAYQREHLSPGDQLSYDILKDALELGLASQKHHFEYLPFDQMNSLPLMIGQMGSGEGMQPFKTEKDYDNWLKRISAFSVWADTAIANFQKGVQKGIVLPKALVVKMIPQMQSMIVKEPQKSLFYAPINKMPKSFSEPTKNRLVEAYCNAIQTEVVPTYKKLGDYLEREYLPKARSTSGYSALPEGKKMYTFLVKQQTTTTKSPEEIYQIGLKEVARIGTLMDSVKKQVGFKGDMKAFFDYMKTDKKFMPYKKPKEVLDAFEVIHIKMEPSLKKMFNQVPKTPFEIRQTEAFRAATASAEYNQGSADGSRPGIFYVPILDAKTFNVTSGMESLFLHEAIPGHHYQISLQQENTALPRFRRFCTHNAYVEGWALYCESLGKELGLYTDLYQYMGALGDEMHRAVRLVVDVAIHTKGMTREQAIKYMMDHEAISEQGATAEIERYMAIPAQALGYKMGSMKIQELRKRCQERLQARFQLASFHDQILKDGSMPLSILERKIDTWAAAQ